MTIDREVFLEGYLAETEEHLGAVARHLAGLGGGTAQPRAVREVFRSLHTIKGLAAMVAVDAIVDIAHAMEVVVRAGEKAGGRLAPRAVDLLAQGVRAIEQRLRLVADKKPVTPAPQALIDALDGIGADAGDSPGADRRASSQPALLDEPMLTASEREQIAQGVNAGRALARLDVVSTPERSAAGLTITAVREKVAAVAEIVRILPRSLPRGDRAPAGLGFALYVLHDGDRAALAAAAGVELAQVVALADPASTPAADTADAAAPDAARSADDDPSGPLDALDDDVGARGGRFVRVDVGRLDDVLEQLSALIVTRFRMDRAVTQLAAAGADTRTLQSILHETGRQLRALRAAVMHARMVSVAELLERVPLMVRGLARTTGKSVALTIDAGDAELDKAVGERVFPAIVHLVRNAVDHGIEAPEARRAAGKPTEGAVRVSCHERNNNQLELSIRDDGRGIDAAALARRAGVALPADDDALLDLLATPGLSTRSEITTTSGRGVGVDIVQRVVRDLGGELSVTTALGEGTTFTMRIPLSITIVEAGSPGTELEFAL